MNGEQQPPIGRPEREPLPIDIERAISGLDTMIEMIKTNKEIRRNITTLPERSIGLHQAALNFYYFLKNAAGEPAGDDLETLKDSDESREIITTILTAARDLLSTHHGLISQHHLREYHDHRQELATAFDAIN